MVRIGPGAFLASPDNVNDMIQGNSRPPVTKDVALFTEVVTDDVAESDVEDPAEPFEKDEDIEEAYEYSASGWFKWRMVDATKR